MAKKSTTQVIDALKAAPVNPIDNTVTITVEQRDQFIRLLRRVDRRDEELRTKYLKKPAARAKGRR